MTPEERRALLERVVDESLAQGAPHVKRAGEAIVAALPDVDHGRLGLACMMLGTSLLKVAGFPPEAIGPLAEMFWLSARPTLIKKPEGGAS